MIFSWRHRIRFLAALLLVAASAQGQSVSTQREFPQSKAAIENALKGLQANLTGRLPTLDGFAVAGTQHSLDEYERGYFQVAVEIASLPSGASLVHATAKITAWYADPAKLHSGYQLLKSNGRIETDLLEQLADQLSSASRQSPPQPSSEISPSNSAASGPVSVPSEPANPSPATAAKPSDDHAISAPSARLPQPGSFPSSLSEGLAEEARSTTAPPGAADKTASKLEKEAEELEQILKNQAHPRNLVAVKKSGTPVVDKPSLTAKTLFLADLHDEFEMLDFNQDWVHVRISGLSRGWIWRDSLEMPDGVSDTATRPSTPVAAPDIFRVAREESAPFPGDWPSLRGKNVKILTIQKVDENPKTGGSQDKLAFSKYLLDKTFGELTGKEPDLAGIVLIFDSADGGMIAATMNALQQWKTGRLSDSALWHSCFFDPPELFAAPAPSGSK